MIGHLLYLCFLDGRVAVGGSQPDEVAGLPRRLLDGVADDREERICQIGYDQADRF